MFMRYRGGGVGHKSTWHLNERLRADSQLAEEQKITDEGGEMEEDEDGGVEEAGGDGKEADEGGDDEDEADEDGWVETDEDSNASDDDEQLAFKF